MNQPEKKKDGSLVPIFLVVFIGFIFSIIASIYSMSRLARENTKELDTMLTYRIYDIIADSMKEPITVARTMSNDKLLANLLKEEDRMTQEEAVVRMQEYLDGLKTGLNYEAAFVVSEKSRRYYTYAGLNKIVDPVNDPHDVWYSLFLECGEDYDLDVDGDEVNKGRWTIFVNARIEDEQGELLGVCGVGVQMTNLQELFRESEKQYKVKINMVDHDGLVQVDTDEINIENAYLENDVLSDTESGEYHYSLIGKNEFAVSKYVEELGWYLVVRSDTTSISAKFIAIILFNIILSILAMGILLFSIYSINKKNLREKEERNELLIRSERAIVANEAKSSFLSSMSHEIRTPINAVLGMNEMILREAESDNIREYAGNIESAGKTLLALINSILDFSKIEEGKMSIIPVRYETKTMINNLVLSVEERARKKRLNLIVDIDKNLPSALIGDDFRLAQVIRNILTNAVKYTDKGHIRLVIRENRAELPGEKEAEEVSDTGKGKKGVPKSDGFGNASEESRNENTENGGTGDGEIDGIKSLGDIHLFVMVEDTGIGIRKEDMGKMFESFERLDEVRNHSIEGTGLGMSIVTGLLEMMGSEIHVNSVYGKGSTFSFVIKQGIADTTPMGDFKESPAPEAKRKTTGELKVEGASVLVVDDNEMNLLVAKKLLKIFDIQAEIVHSGYECIESMRSKHYDIVFLDHMMPDMDGKETLDTLKKSELIPEGTKIIVLTANAVNGAREDYLAAGFDDYLSKPIEVDELREILKLHLPQSMLHE